MKILQLGKFYPIRGGVEKVMWDLTAGLSDSGVQCDMLCASLPEDRPEGGMIVLNPCGRVICVPAVRKIAATMISPAMIRWLRAHRSDYDIVHIHHPDPMACLALRLSGFKGKVVLHWHSDILKQKTLLRLYKPLQSWLIRRAGLIVGTTPVYVEESPFLTGAGDKLRCLPIGVLPVPEAPESGPGGGSEKIVFSLGRLVEYKGFEYLIDAARSLPEHYKVVIAGEGPLRDSLQARIDSAGLGDRVRLIGRISDEEKAQWFRRCDVFCLSSIWKTEAFAIVQIEAMSCGKPVVATLIPGSGVSWVNLQGVSGLNVPVKDPGALAEAVLAITSDRSVYEGFCAGAGERYRSCFTLDTMISGCISLYKELLDED